MARSNRLLNGLGKWSWVVRQTTKASKSFPARSPTDCDGFENKQCRWSAGRVQVSYSRPYVRREKEAEGPLSGNGKLGARWLGRLRRIREASISFVVFASSSRVYRSSRENKESYHLSTNHNHLLLFTHEHLPTRVKSLRLKLQQTCSSKPSASSSSAV